MRKKGLALVLALALMVVGAVGGTLAWLTAQSGTVTNTFTTSDITVKLEEKEGTPVTNGREFKMIPGYAIKKDPKVTVLADSEECFLFVKLDESANFKDFLTYKMANGWEQLKKDKDGNDITGLVYYRKVLTEDIGTEYSVLQDNQVTVNDKVTKKQMNDLTQDNLPKLTITAYASQLHKNADKEFTPAEAWANVNP